MATSIHSSHSDIGISCEQPMRMLGSCNPGIVKINDYDLYLGRFYRILIIHGSRIFDQNEDIRQRTKVIEVARKICKLNWQWATSLDEQTSIVEEM